MNDLSSHSLLPVCQTSLSRRETNDWIAFGLLILGGALCFGLSTGDHILSNHSHAVHNVYHLLDLLGISTVTAGSFPPARCVIRLPFLGEKHKDVLDLRMRKCYLDLIQRHSQERLLIRSSSSISLLRL